MLVRQLNQTKGVDLLSAPRVTTKSEQKATIEIIQEFIYPTAFQQNKGPFAKPVTTPTNFDKKNTGVTLEVTPTIEPDGKVIDLSLTWTITNFDGFVDVDGKPVLGNEKEMPEKMPGATFPVFDTRSVSTVVTLPSGAAIVFSRDEEHLFARKSLRFATGEAGHKVSPAKDGARLLLVFITATLVDPAGTISAKTNDPFDHLSTPVAPGIYKSDQPPSQSADASAQLPYGVPVPGKPGLASCFWYRNPAALPRLPSKAERWHWHRSRKRLLPVSTDPIHTPTRSDALPQPLRGNRACDAKSRPI